MQNGCTSGHGLTGLARLSFRSWFAVPTFMAAGVLAATLSGTATSLPPDGATDTDWALAVTVVACVVALLVCIAGASILMRRINIACATTAAPVVAELFVGASFGCGLAISGMARPSKVAAFLDLGSGRWDPSLALVMGGGLLVTFPFFQALQRLGVEGPVLGGTFELPTNTSHVDLGFVLGAVVFGIGWGICGLCPGPVWVASGAAPSLEMATAVLGMLAGTASMVIADKRREKVNPTQENELEAGSGDAQIQADP